MQLNKKDVIVFLKTTGWCSCVQNSRKQNYVNILLAWQSNIKFISLPHILGFVYLSDCDSFLWNANLNPLLYWTIYMLFLDMHFFFAKSIQTRNQSHIVDLYLLGLLFFFQPVSSDDSWLLFLRHISQILVILSICMGFYKSSFVKNCNHT